MAMIACSDSRVNMVIHGHRHDAIKVSCYRMQFTDCHRLLSLVACTLGVIQSWSDWCWIQSWSDWGWIQSWLLHDGRDEEPRAGLRGIGAGLLAINRNQYMSISHMDMDGFSVPLYRRTLGISGNQVSVLALPRQVAAQQQLQHIEQPIRACRESPSGHQPASPS